MNIKEDWKQEQESNTSLPSSKNGAFFMYFTVFYCLPTAISYEGCFAFLDFNIIGNVFILNGTDLVKLFVTFLLLMRFIDGCVSFMAFL